MIMDTSSDKLLLGINFGDHKINKKTLIRDLKREVVGKSDVFILRSKPEYPLDTEDYKKIARFASKYKVYFAILYAFQHPPKNKVSHLDKEKVDQIKKYAGEYFLGEVFAEAGSQYTAMNKGYYIDTPDECLKMPDQSYKTMSEAREKYVKHLSEMLYYNRKIGIDGSIMIEPTATGAYALEAGFDTLMLEMLPADPDVMLPFTRGASRAYIKKDWGALIAHEWYGGYKHTDILKLKRLELSYKYLFMHGANYVFIESGTNEVCSFGNYSGYNSRLCKNYRKAHNEFYDFLKNNQRPSHGPITEVAFIYGNDDGFPGFLGGSSWCQFDREEWGISDEEGSWNILSEIYRSHASFHADNYAVEGVDLSHSPSYGTYDVIPSTAPLGVMKKYKYLIFAGHNTMTKELMIKLNSYVRSGGILFASASHLNTLSDRKGNYEQIENEYVKDLFGVVIIGRRRINCGVKFENSSFVNRLTYPSSNDGACDANYIAGYTDIADIKISGATIRGVFSDSFEQPTESSPVFLTEYKNGKGVAIFTTHLNYPGNPSVYPVYRAIIKCIINSSHANAKIKVFGSDKIRFSVYKGTNGLYKLYLLNTSFDCPVTAGVIYKKKTYFYDLAPGELSSYDLP